jgi:hypothetical protein
VPDAASRTPNEWNILFDIGDVPVNAESEIHFRVRFWNAFQDPRQWWAGFRILHDTTESRFTVVFPPGKHPLPESLVYVYVQAKEYPYNGTPEIDVSRDDGGRVERVSWRVTDPHGNRSYRIKWDWSR